MAVADAARTVTLPAPGAGDHGRADVASGQESEAYPAAATLS